MKKVIFLTAIIASVSMICKSCSFYRELAMQEKRAARLIEKIHKDVDTVYQLILLEPDSYFNLVWYHRDGFIHSFEVEPIRTRRRDPIEAENISIDDERLDIYFWVTNESHQCFYHSILPADSTLLYIKNEKPLSSCINISCLFKKEFSSKSFPHKLRYDLYKLGIFPCAPWKPEDLFTEEKPEVNELENSD